MVLSWDQRWLSSHLCLQRESTILYTVILTIHIGIVYSLIGETELLDEPTEMVGLARSLPAEDGSSVTEDKWSEVSNGVNISCRSLVSVNVYLLVPNTAISTRYKGLVDVMLILRYLPRASVVRFITTSLLPASLKSENIVLSVLVERCSALWTERLRVGILLGATNVIFTLPMHHPWGMSSTKEVGINIPSIHSRAATQ